MRSWLASDRLLGGLLPVLAIVAEGAWLTVVYVAVQTGIGGQRPLLGTFELSVAAGAAALAVRRGWLRPDDQPLRFFVLLLATGAVGWLWDADARQAVVSGDLVRALAMHPGGWLTIVASMRGVGRGGEIDDRAQTRLVLVGVPALAVPWLMGGATPAALRPVFAEEAFVASITFVAAGFMAAGLARLGEIGRETGIDWRRDRSWLGFIVGILLIVLAVGIPSAYLLGIPVDAVARGLFGPIVGLLGYLLLAVAYVLGLVAAAVYAVLSGVGIRLPPPMTPAELARLMPVRAYDFEDLRGPLVTVGVIWIGLVVLSVVLLVSWARRRAGRRASRPDEERSFQVPGPGLRLRLPRMRPPARGPRGTPTDAVGAYLAALRLLAERPPLGRSPAETPHRHAARVAPSADPELGALQADYALARYGGRDLTDAEHVRAVGRWRRLRDRLRSRGPA